MISLIFTIFTDFLDFHNFIEKVNISLKTYFSIIPKFWGFPAAGRPIENFRPGRRRPPTAAAILSKSLASP